MRRKPCSGPPGVRMYEPVISLPFAEMPSTLVEKGARHGDGQSLVGVLDEEEARWGPPGERVYDPVISLPFAETPVTTVELAPCTLTVWKIGSASTSPAMPRNSATIPKNTRMGGTL